MEEPRVEVVLFGALAARFGSTSAWEPARRDVPIGGDSRIADVLATISLDPGEVSHLFLNGRYSAVTRRVAAGDRLGVFGRDMALLYRQYFAKSDDPS